MEAFENLKEIMALRTNEEKQEAWLKNYDGLNCMACSGSIPEDYKQQSIPYDSKRFDKSINLIGRNKSRLCIEFDNKNLMGEPNKDACRIAIEKIKLKLDIKKHGYIVSSHNGISPYLWIEFNRDLTKKEAEQYLTMICPKKDEIDFNFAQDDTILPVLFAEHWKYPGQIEEVIEFKEGSKIDFDELGIKDLEVSYSSFYKNKFNYKTFKKKEKGSFEKSQEEKLGIIWDDDEILKKRHFPIDLHNDKLFFGLLMTKKKKKFRREQKDGDKKAKLIEDGTKQVSTPCLMTGVKSFREVDDETKEEYAIDFHEIPSSLPQRWDLKKLKDYIDGKKEAVNGEELFGKISNQYKKYLAIRKDTWYSIYTLWDIGTYIYPIFEAYPLMENRGIAGTGKSKSMDVSSMITFNGGQLMVNPSESTLFRETEEVRGTKYFDEAEKLWVYNKATKQYEGDTRTELINASYTKSAKVPRQERIGSKFVTKWYTPYSPTQLSSINGLYGATAQRAITRMCTKSSNKDPRGETEPREDKNLPIWSEIRDECYRYALENYQEIRNIYLNFDNDCGLKRRDMQIWKPLLSIAKHISEDVYKDVLSFAIKNSKRKQEHVIPESSFDYMVLKAFSLSIESATGTRIVYVDGIKRNYCALIGDDEKLNDIYLNRTISKHLDKLGFEDFRGRKNSGAFFDVSSDTFNEIVSPICPELVINDDENEILSSPIDMGFIPKSDDSVDNDDVLEKKVLKEKEGDEDNVNKKNKKNKNLSTLSTLSSLLHVKQPKLGDDEVVIGGDKDNLEVSQKQ